MTKKLDAFYGFGVEITKPAFASEEDVKNLANAECGRGKKAVFQRFHGRGKYIFACASM